MQIVETSNITPFLFPTYEKLVLVVEVEVVVVVVVVMVVVVYQKNPQVNFLMTRQCYYKSPWENLSTRLRFLKREEI